MSLILASGSPRRRELLHFITDDFSVIVSDADETVKEKLSPRELVMYLAEIKGRAVAGTHYQDTVISADTVVVLDDKILGKPHSEQEAYEMLSSLSGRTHSVYTGVFVAKGDRYINFAEKAEVTFYKLSEKEIRDYISTGESFDKAGGYGIQGRGALLIKGICGDFYNVMGLPVAELSRRLKENGFIE